MRHFIIIIISVFTFFSVDLLSQAEDIGIDWGPIRSEKDMNFTKIIGIHGDNFYTISSGDGGLFSSRSDDDFIVMALDRGTKAVKFKTELRNFEYQGNQAKYQNALLKPDGTVVIYFVTYDSKADTKTLIYREMDNDGKFSASKELATVSTDRRSEGGFKVFTSRDSTKLVVYSEIPKERKENEEFKVEVFDRDHNQIWTRTIELPYTNRYFTILDQALSNAGELFILGYSEPDRSKGEKKERNASNEDYKMYRLNAMDDIVEFDLDLDEKYVNDASIHADYYEDLVAVPGFYSDNFEGGISGAFFFTIRQSDLSVVTTSTEQFGRELMLNFMSERKLEKGRELGNFDFMRFIRREDGGVVVVAEQNFKVVTQTRDANGNFYTSVTYYSNDIIVINIDPDGQIQWSAVVPKKQSLGGPYYLSHLLMVDGDRLHFVYNDHAKNLMRYGTDDRLKYMSNVKKSTAVIATVDSEGNVTHNLLFHNKSYKALLVPRKSYQSTDDRVILYAVRKNDSRFGTMEIR